MSGDNMLDDIMKGEKRATFFFGLEEKKREKKNPTKTPNKTLPKNNDKIKRRDVKIHKMTRDAGINVRSN